jgi:hypothetical protein
LKKKNNALHEEIAKWSDVKVMMVTSHGWQTFDERFVTTTAQFATERAFSP